MSIDTTNEASIRNAMERRDVPDHLHDGFVNYLKYAYMPGDALTAILSNDLKKTFMHADESTIAGLHAIVMFLYNDVPGNAWGSPEKAKAWLEQVRQERERERQEREREQVGEADAMVGLYGDPT